MFKFYFIPHYNISGPKGEKGHKGDRGIAITNYAGTSNNK